MRVPGRAQFQTCGHVSASNRDGMETALPSGMNGQLSNLLAQRHNVGHDRLL